MRETIGIAIITCDRPLSCLKDVESLLHNEWYDEYS